MKTARLWIGFIVVVAVSFTVLSYFGAELYRQAPPIPQRVVTAEGEVLFTGQDIHDGQNVWQSTGGQENGTIWGHGSYVAPDWSADFLHRECVGLLDVWSQRDHHLPYARLDAETQAALRERLTLELRTNTYDAKTGDLVLSVDRARTVEQVAAHYASLFSDDPETAALREAYALKDNAIKTPERQAKMNAFFFWTAWACAANRPGEAYSYTNNWPAEPLIGNHPTASIVLWSAISVVVLLAGVGALAWYFAVQRHKKEGACETPEADPLWNLSPTPSMRATLKYFWVVAALMVVQVGLGG